MKESREGTLCDGIAKQAIIETPFVHVTGFFA